MPLLHKTANMKIKNLSATFLLFSLATVTSIRNASAECFDFPDPMNVSNRTAVQCNLVTDTNSGNTTIVPSSQFHIDFTCGVNDQVLCSKANNVFTSVGEIIASSLQINTPINVEAKFVNLCPPPPAPCNTLGSALSARTIGLKDDDGVTRQYPQALVKQFRCPNHSEFSPVDIRAAFNTGMANGTFWFPGDLPITKDQIDFQTLVLHEFIHGLGFDSSWRLQSGLNNALMPTVTVSPTMTNGIQVEFQENAFDRYLVLLPELKRVTELTATLQAFGSGPGAKCANASDFFTNFQASPEFAIAKSMAVVASTPGALGLLPRGSTQAGNAVILETAIHYTAGLSITHMDFKTYANTSDFLMVSTEARGMTLNDFVTRGNAKSGPIGPNLRAILETLGYPTSENENTSFKVCPGVPSPPATSPITTTTSVQTSVQLTTRISTVSAVVTTKVIGPTQTEILTVLPPSTSTYVEVIPITASAPVNTGSPDSSSSDQEGGYSNSHATHLMVDMQSALSLALTATLLGLAFGGSSVLLI